MSPAVPIPAPSPDADPVPSSGDGPGDTGAPRSAVDRVPSESAPSPTSPATAGPAAGGLVFDDPFDRPAADDTDRGWGDSHSGSAEDDFTRFLNEKPPHHI